MNKNQQYDHNPRDESDLAAKALTDSAALAVLYDHYFPRIHKYALYRVGDFSAADDLTSEIFEQMLNALPRYKPQRAPFGAWLFGIARHAVNDHHRSQKQRQEVHSEEMEHLIATEPQPEQASLIIEADQNLLSALKQLSARELDIIGLKFAAEMTNRQIAKLTGLGESHVGVILFRSMQRLRLLLIDLEKNDEH